MLHAAVILSLALATSCAGKAPDGDAAPASGRTEETTAAAAETAGQDTMLRLSIPQRVADRAAARARGDASAPPPILVLEDVEIGAGEGLRIEIVGPPDPETREQPVLAVSSLVGAPQAELAEPRERMTLVVPLNDVAVHLMAGKREITLTLRVTGSPGRPALKVERAYFDARPQ